MQDIVLRIGGMSCQGCVKNVTGVLSAVPGVADVSVSLEAAEARVRYDDTKVAEDQLRAAVEGAGFETD